MENASSKYWEQKISEWRTSGLSVREWCSKNQIDMKQFYIWRNQFESVKTPESEEPVFAEVTSYHQSNQKSFRTTAQDNRLMLYYQGIKVYVPEDFNSETFFYLVVFLLVIYAFL